MTRSRTFTKCLVAATLLAAPLLSSCSGDDAEPEMFSADRTSFYGAWQIAEPSDVILTINGETPPLLPEAAAAYARTQAAKAAGDLSWDGVQQCKFHGAVRILFETMPFEFVQDPAIIYLMSQWNREYRMIHMDVEHYDPAGPQLMGQSVGHWEGDTLVVDTIHFADGENFLDASGMPTSDQLHLVERFSVSADGQTMTNHITIEDPAVFSQAWETEVTFARQPEGTRIVEDACVDRLKLEQYQ